MPWSRPNSSPACAASSPPAPAGRWSIPCRPRASAISAWWRGPFEPAILYEIGVFHRRDREPSMLAASFSRTAGGQAWRLICVLMVKSRRAPGRSRPMARFQRYLRLRRAAGRHREREARLRAAARAGARGSPANSGRSIPVPYGGWRARKAMLRLADGRRPACHPLVRTIATPAGGLTAEVIDLGRGTPEEFEAHAADIRAASCWCAMS